MRKAFVIGWPIGHSRSPALHGYWLKQYAIEGTYQAIPVKPVNLSSFADQMESNGFVGGNVTIPHKESILEIADAVDETAAKIGAANTVWVENGKLKASNTDAYGFSANLDEHAPDWRHGDIATILGAGGASRAVIFAVLEAGYQQVRIVNRTLTRAEQLAERFGSLCSAHQWESLNSLLSDTQLLINTTSLGMKGVEETQQYSLNQMAGNSIVTDLVYNPLQTDLLKSAQMSGLKTVDGLGMLLHQAAPGFEQWFGIRPEVTTELRKHVLASG